MQELGFSNSQKQNRLGNGFYEVATNEYVEDMGVGKLNKPKEYVQELCIEKRAKSIC